MLAAHDTLLANLQGKGRYRFKRYRGLPLRYAGGKSLAVGYIIEQLPRHIPQLVSPFMGGGSVEIACARDLGMRVLAFDVFDILVSYWQVQLRAPKKLAAHIGQWTASKKTYQQVKQRLAAHWHGTNLITDKLELAAHYWFNHNLSYGPGFLGWMSGLYEDQPRYHRLLDKVAAFTCPGLKVGKKSFEKTLARHKQDFLYCDPPYYLDGDSRMFRGIYPQRNFPIHHTGFDHGLLCRLLHQHKGGFILSYNDCAQVRSWYKDFRIVEVAWHYTLGQGETRIGKNRALNGSYHHVKKSHELLIIKDS